MAAYSIIILLSVSDFLLLLNNIKWHARFVTFYLFLLAGTLLLLNPLSGRCLFPCILFLLLDLATNLFNLYLDKASLEGTKQFSWNFLGTLWIKMSCYLLAMSMYNYSYPLFYFKFGVDSGLLLAFLLYVVTYRKDLIPPTVSELFIQDYKILSLTLVYSLFNSSISLFAWIKASNEVGIAFLSLANFTTALIGVITTTVIDVAFVTLIFIFDTNSREEKLKEKHRKNVLHMAFLVAYVFVKCSLNYQFISIHNMPMLLSAVYFIYMNYEINEELNSRLLPIYTNKKDEYKAKKNSEYGRNIKKHLMCLFYEVIFLMTWMSFVPRVYDYKNYFVNEFLLYLGHNLSNISNR